MNIQLTPFGKDILQILNEVNKTIEEQEKVRAQDFTKDIMDHLDCYMEAYEKKTADIYKNNPIIINRKVVENIENINEYFNKKGMKTKYNLDLRINQICIELTVFIEDELRFNTKEDLALLDNLVSHYKLSVTYSERDMKTVMIIIFENVGKPMTKEDA